MTLTDATSGTVNETRTYGWYVTHGFFSDGKIITRSLDQKSCNAPTPREHLENLTKEGLADQVPTPENIRPLLERYLRFSNAWKANWAVYEQAETTRSISRSIGSWAIS